MTETELRQAVRKLSKLRRPGARSSDGHVCQVPCYTFQALNQGWWELYAKTHDWNDQARIIATELAAMDSEISARWIRKLPGDAIAKARGVDYDMGKAQAKYDPEEGSDDGGKSD